MNFFFFRYRIFTIKTSVNKEVASRAKQIEALEDHLAASIAQVYTCGCTSKLIFSASTKRVTSENRMWHQNRHFLLFYILSLSSASWIHRTWYSHWNRSKDDFQRSVKILLYKATVHKRTDIWGRGYLPLVNKPIKCFPATNHWDRCLTTWDKHIFINLFLKISNPTHFRPISSCNIPCKVMQKSLMKDLGAL